MRSEPIPLDKLPGLPQLTRNYLCDFDRVAALFDAPPSLNRSWSESADGNRRQRVNPAALAEILEDQNRSLGAPARSLANVRLLAQEETLAVVTGQQVGYLGGAAYTLHKALTAVRLAEHIARTTGRPCVPVFYLVSEDHDLDEIRHAHILGEAHELIRLSLELSATQRPAFQVSLPETCAEHLEILRKRLPETPFRDELLGALSATYQPGETLPRAFARWMLTLLQDAGLVILDASDGRLKRLASRLFLWEIEEGSASTRALIQVNRELEARGYQPQIQVRGGRFNLFFLERGRHAVHEEGPEVAVPSLGRRWSKREFQAMIEENPECLSPNVVLRPLFQDLLLPTVAYVAGPAEIAYFAQLSAVYRSFGLQMPVIWPRATFTLLTPPVQRYLDRLGLEPAQVVAGNRVHQLLTTRDEELAEIHEHVAQLAHWVTEGWGPLHRAIVSLDGSLDGYLRKTLTHMLHSLQEVEAKAAQAKRRKDQDLARQLQAIENTIRPLGKLQERVLSPLSFLVRTGPELPRLLLEQISLDSFEHRICYL
ncbi:MAG: bacillithiol biosynthesis cysteine-adding enzyme BshC [candidate division KSB1 bacterium]|nr:bacillithiol biosynthesis cysteine-adding enzyme BshC [candidate division KSB1 bacterium]